MEAVLVRPSCELAARELNMEASSQESGLWKQIDDAEYYLVSGSFEQAAYTALSVSDQIRTAALENGCDHVELLEMLESAGMVLVQALKELKRTTEMFVHLKEMFGSVASIPVKVFFAGATMQMAAGSVSDLRPIFEEYLGKWRYTNDGTYVLNREQDNTSNDFSVTVMSAEQYFEVAELYTVTLLSIVSRQSKPAISWAEKAELTEQNREVLLKKLQTLQSAADNKASTVKMVNQTAERNLSTSTNKDAPNTVSLYSGLNKDSVKSTEPSIQRVANQFDPLFWWFHSVRLKFGKVHIVLPSGKLMLLFSLLVSTMFVLRRKTAGLKRTVFQHASSLRRAFFDALQLAFSVPTNTLAAVQQVPQGPRAS